VFLNPDSVSGVFQNWTHVVARDGCPDYTNKNIQKTLERNENTKENKKYEKTLKKQ